VKLKLNYFVLPIPPYFVQFFIVAHSQLKMAWIDTGLLVVASCVAGQFQDFRCQILQNGGQIDGRSGTNAFGVMT
jgi:hypothetical protein